MKKSNFRTTMFSIVAGIVFGLAIILSFNFSQTVSAEYYCPDSGDCPGGYCFTNGTGTRSCNYWGNLPSCASTCKFVKIEDVQEIGQSGGSS